MADTKISALTAAASVDGTEAVPLVQGGATKKGLLSTIKSWLFPGLSEASKFVPLGVNTDVSSANDGVLRDAGGNPLDHIDANVIHRTGNLASLIALADVGEIAVSTEAGKEGLVAVVGGALGTLFLSGMKVAYGTAFNSNNVSDNGLSPSLVAVTGLSFRPKLVLLFGGESTHTVGWSFAVLVDQGVQGLSPAGVSSWLGVTPPSSGGLEGAVLAVPYDAAGNQFSASLYTITNDGFTVDDLLASSPPLQALNLQLRYVALG